MIVKNSSEISQVSQGNIDIDTIYQGETELWTSAPKYLNYQGMCSKDFIGTASYNSNVMGITYDYFDSSFVYKYPCNIRYYDIGSEEITTEPLDIIFNNGLNTTDIKSNKIKIPSKYKQVPIVSLSRNSLYSVNNVNEVRTKKDLILMDNCFGSQFNYKEANPQPTAETFSLKDYYYRNGNIYVKSTSYDSSTTYYVGDCVVNNLKLTEYTPKIDKPNISYLYAKLDDNDYAMCLGFTGSTLVYLRDTTEIGKGELSLYLHPQCKYIYSDAFSSNLITNTISEKIGTLIFYTRVGTESICSLTQICSNAFRGCKYLTGFEDNHYHLYFPKNLRWISDNAFENSLSDPNHSFDVYLNSCPIEYIGQNAFANCTAVTTFYMSNIGTKDNPLTIRMNAFYNCLNLQYVDLIGANIWEIEPYVFTKCTSLRYASTVDLSSYFNKNAYLVTYSQPESVQDTSSREYYLGTCLIYGRYKVEQGQTYKISQGTQHIAGCAFVTRPLDDINNEETIETLPYYNQVIQFPDSLLSIGKYCFGNTTKNQWSKLGSVIFDGIYELSSNGGYINDGYGYVKVNSGGTYAKKSPAQISIKLKLISTGAFYAFSSWLFTGENSRFKYINLTQCLKQDIAPDEEPPIVYNKSTFVDRAWNLTDPLTFYIDRDNFPNFYNKIIKNRYTNWNVWNECNIITTLPRDSSYNYIRMLDFPTTCSVIKSLAFGNSKETFYNETI